MADWSLLDGRYLSHLDFCFGRRFSPLERIDNPFLMLVDGWDLERGEYIPWIPLPYGLQKDVFFWILFDHRPPHGLVHHLPDVVYKHQSTFFTILYWIINLVIVEAKIPHNNLNFSIIVQEMQKNEENVIKKSIKYQNNFILHII